MTKSERTNSGTYIVNDIEYNEFPPPSHLYKAMEYNFAVKLIKNGEIKLNSYEYLRAREDPEIGDKYEGKGKFMMDDKPMYSSSSNKVYVWSSSVPSVELERLIKIDENYDTIIRIDNPSLLATRCFDKLYNKFGIFHTHLGTVQYNRGKSVTKAELNNQKWHHNAFQKESNFKHQKEYRLTFTDFQYQMNDDFIIIEIGSCEDIISIEREV
ncbi:MAG: hypothetical protein ACQETE_11105 [Bacteroidota bacterium]